MYRLFVIINVELESEMLKLSTQMTECHIGVNTDQITVTPNIFIIVTITYMLSTVIDCKHKHQYLVAFAHDFVPPTSCFFAELAADADDKLFSQVLYNNMSYSYNQAETT